MAGISKCVVVCNLFLVQGIFSKRLAWPTQEQPEKMGVSFDTNKPSSKQVHHIQVSQHGGALPMLALQQQANPLLAVDGGTHPNTHSSTKLSRYKPSEGQIKWEAGK